MYSMCTVAFFPILAFSNGCEGDDQLYMYMNVRRCGSSRRVATVCGASIPCIARVQQQLCMVENKSVNGKPSYIK